MRNLGGWKGGSNEIVSLRLATWERALRTFVRPFSGSCSWPPPIVFEPQRRAQEASLMRGGVVVQDRKEAGGRKRRLERHPTLATELLGAGHEGPWRVAVKDAYAQHPESGPAIGEPLAEGLLGPDMEGSKHRQAVLGGDVLDQLDCGE